MWGHIVQLLSLAGGSIHTKIKPSSETHFNFNVHVEEQTWTVCKSLVIIGYFTGHFSIQIPKTERTKNIVNNTGILKIIEKK